MQGLEEKVSSRRLLFSESDVCKHMITQVKKPSSVPGAAGQAGLLVLIDCTI